LFKKNAYFLLLISLLVIISILIFSSKYQISKQNNLQNITVAGDNNYKYIQDRIDENDSSVAKKDQALDEKDKMGNETIANEDPELSNMLSTDNFVIDDSRLVISDNYLQVLKIYNEANIIFYNGDHLDELEIKNLEIKKLIMAQYAEKLGINITEQEYTAYITNVNKIKDKTMTDYLNHILKARNLTEEQYWLDKYTVDNQKTGLLLAKLTSTLGGPEQYAQVQKDLWDKYLKG